ncbi:hypothetical protein MMC25_006365 [Agyrium rufum]|nr:hypothetical protein [Agyrium rufum]
MQSGDLWLTPPANVHRIFATGCFKDIRDAHDMGGLKFLFKDPQPSDLSSGKPEGLLQMQLFHRTRFGSLPSAIRKRINNHIFGVVLPQTTADRKARRVVWASTSSNLQKRHPVMAAVDVLLVCRKMNLEATEVFHKHFQLAFQDIPYAADYLNTLKPLKRRMIEDIHFTDGFADWWATEPCHLKRLPNLRQLSFNFVGPRAFKSDCYVLDGKEDPSRQDDGDMTETDVALADSSSMADLFDDEFAIIAWRRSSLSTSPHLLRLFSAHVVKTVRKQLLYDADSKLLLAKEKITTTKPTRIAGRKKKRKVKSYFGIDKDDISEREYESMVHIVTENF